MALVHCYIMGNYNKPHIVDDIPSYKEPLLYNGELPKKNIPTFPSPGFPVRQAPAIYVSQVRSAKAAPLTGSGKVPRYAASAVPALAAHLCLASRGWWDLGYGSIPIDTFEWDEHPF